MPKGTTDSLVISQQERVSGSVMTSSTLNTVAMSQPSVLKKPPNTKLRIFSTVRIDVILL